MNRFTRGMLGLLSWLFSLGFTLLVIAVAVGVGLFSHYSQDLPDYSQLAKYEPPNITRLYAADGRLLAEYAIEKRVFVPLKAIPRRVIQAFISAEDKNFYAHEGIDITGIARAVRDNIVNYGQGKSLVGGSTITQQVVKNFLLSNEKSLERKIKEAILAMRISRAYSKDKILELYLNQIYLGMGSYGAAAAALNYFNKSLDDLTLEEIALLAAQPKAPALYNPKKNYDAARERRDWVIERMREDGAVTADEAAAARQAPIEMKNRDVAETTQADFFAEEVRRQLAHMYGANVLYEGGLVVKTTLDPKMQQAADRALRLALVEYDRRRGYRGPVAHFPAMGAKVDDWKERLVKLAGSKTVPLFEKQRLALVITLSDKKAQIVLEDESRGVLPLALLGWTRRVIDDGELGPEIKKPGDILRVGDVVIVAPPSDEQKKTLEAADRKNAWDLQQIPAVGGALVALDPHTGRVLAMSGGYAYGATEFNRATQARRQPGSAFKPFVYLAGLENGFTPATVILDAPVEMSQGEGLPTWKPQNYKDEYLGPIPMRVGLEKSRNTMTVRLAQMIGIDKVIEVGTRFGIYDDPPRNFSIVLGAAETTLLRLTNAYGMLVDGGRRIVPSLIERIDDRHGKTIYRRDNRECSKCLVADPQEPEKDMPPLPEDTSEQVLDPRVAYQMVSMLEGAVLRGTGARAREIGKIVGGKTGTTNDSMDAWFIGFSPDLVAGVYIGYDTPRSLGEKETGASVALPAFVAFMKEALAGKPSTPFRVPRGIQLIRVDPATGQPLTGAEGEGSRIIEEAFITGGGPIFIPGTTPVSSRETPDMIVNPEGSDTEPMLVNPPAPGIPLETPPTAGESTGGLY